MKHLLFSPYTIKSVTLKNRIVMSPMCMYSSHNQDGHTQPFHLAHYESRAAGQVGLVMTEATSVTPEGRISHEDLGIWSDDHTEGLSTLTEAIHRHGAKAGIQLAHAGRKANLDSDIYAPSASSFSESLKTPVEMNEQQISYTVQSFKEGAERAKESRFDIIELHGAHGYLINQFLSPLTNFRTDKYGGSREKRYRFLSEIIDAVRESWTGPLFVRISGAEYHENGNKMEDFIYFAEKMKAQGVDLIDVSSGGVVPAPIDPYPGYQVKYAEKIKAEAGIDTGAVGLITSGNQAEEILRNERADLIFLARALLKNPYWPKQAADELGYKLEGPRQYTRAW
ncbi:NADPH dehydrogenase NamA [Halobacillus halophilus]|uniref:NADPH dehydrogenase n=1 Tax=Halobacillus halophilus (strain ATCC 35676 / DSM 2266 / JCM 20832 / KCTC 3685 / LMG 17431 / NBRC 102448 / NCIMB 2269) TaxID=866895 RepID=I0JNQ6_HALH3|nr:NADPH dehydrogenase NamA [Halobacillus halophilus]ASF39823.1 NADPH dehydrogenase NamA [Halobacillus halophilus]CCG45776.1 NAD(P)H dehydrogenase [Halobacillus halophilus DSM 2266]